MGELTQYDEATDIYMYVTQLVARMELADQLWQETLQPHSAEEAAAAAAHPGRGELRSPGGAERAAAADTRAGEAS